MVATAKGDFDRLSAVLSDNIIAPQSKWQGQGGTAFFNLHQAWTEKQNRIVQALNEFEASLTSTERDNINTDQSQSDYKKPQPPRRRAAADQTSGQGRT